MAERSSSMKIFREPGGIGNFVGLFAALVVGFLIIPVIFVIFYSFNSTAYITYPPKGVSLHWYKNFFGLENFRHAIGISLGLAAVVTPVTNAIGIGAAYAVVRGRFRGAQLLNAFFLSPLIIPGVVTGLALMTFFGTVGLKWSFINLALGLTLFSLPFPIRTVSANMHGLNPVIEEAAINLGASRWTSFFKIVLPQLKPGILSGFIFVFVTVLDNVTVVIFLTSIGTTTLSVEALEYVRAMDDPTIAAMSAMLIACTVILVFVIERFIGLDKFMSLE